MTAWTPGDPLHSPAAHPHSRYLFNFRDESVSETCRCMDAASWPEPLFGAHVLTESDDLLTWIAQAQAGAR